MSSVLFVPDKFGCRMTHLQFNLSLSDSAEVNTKHKSYDKTFDCCSRRRTLFEFLKTKIVITEIRIISTLLYIITMNV